MSSKHTPGPWRVGGQMTLDNAMHPTIIRGPDGHFIARMAKQAAQAVNDDLTSQANARLIAAAPELLAALRMAFHMLPTNADAARCAVIRAAIAKAEPCRSN